jgi:adenosylcobinamide amidohydrolase
MFLELHRAPNASMMRNGRFIAVRFLRPHRVLSTSHVNGGQHHGLSHMANHQSCEGSGHTGRGDRLHRLSPAQYHDEACAEGQLPPSETCLLGTAASMDYASLVTETWQELSVTVWATGGVKGNAARAGDAARWHESGGRWVESKTLEASLVKSVSADCGNAEPEAMTPGTINTLIVVNHPLLPAALARAVAIMSEAKAAVLYELAVPTLQGFGLATGTGTDQFALASPLPAPGENELTWSGHHTKLGELIGQACLKAYRETLRWQNGLEPSLTRNLAWAGKGMGITETALREALSQHLEGEHREVALRNTEALLHHPKAAAELYAMRALEERVQYGTLPATLLPELLLEHALLLACHVAMRSEAASTQTVAIWRETLAPLAHNTQALALKALALGFDAKWA